MACVCAWTSEELNPQIWRPPPRPRAGTNPACGVGEQECGVIICNEDSSWLRGGDDYGSLDGVSDSKPIEHQNNSPFTRTVADRPGMRTVSHPLQRVRFTVGSLAGRVSDGNAARMSQDESTYIFTVVFCPINLIARTYPCPISAARITRFLRWRSLLADCAFGSSACGSEGVANSEVSAGASCIVCIEELTLGLVCTSLLNEIDSTYAEAWYRKLSRCRMSRFTTPFGFGVSPLFFLPIGVQAWRAK